MEQDCIVKLKYSKVKCFRVDREEERVSASCLCVSDGSREGITGEELREGERGETAHG